MAVAAVTDPEAFLLEPQSTGLFVLLIVVFGGLTWWMLVTRQPVFRLLAACLAFIPAMLFGVVAVNKYYGYYQTWSAALADLTGQGGAAGTTAPPPGIVTAGTLTGGGQAAAGQFGTLTGSNALPPAGPAAGLHAASDGAARAATSPGPATSTCRPSTSSPATGTTGSRSSS